GAAGLGGRGEPERVELAGHDGLETGCGDGEEAERQGMLGGPSAKYDTRNAFQSACAAVFWNATKWPSPPDGAYRNTAGMSVRGREIVGPSEWLTGSISSSTGETGLSPSPRALSSSVAFGA